MPSIMLFLPNEYCRTPIFYLSNFIEKVVGIPSL
jgi:hypothetical protein